MLTGALAQADPVAAPGNVRKALGSLAALSEMDGVAVRVHRGVTYNGICYADDDVLVAQGVHGSQPVRPRCCTGRRLRKVEWRLPAAGAFARFWFWGTG